MRFGVLLILSSIALSVPSSADFQEAITQTSNDDGVPDAADTLRFSNPVNLTNNTRDSVYAQVASHGNNVYVVWQENLPSRSNDNSVNYEIFITKSVDGGLTFGNEINLSNNLGFSEHPQIATSESNVYVVWTDNSPADSSQAPENKKIFFCKSGDDGNTFSKTITLSNMDSDAYNQEIAAAGNDVYVVWQEDDLRINAQSDPGIMFSSSADKGESFKKSLSLSNSAYKSYPKVAAYGNSVYIVWNVGIIGENNVNNKDNGIFLAKSTDNGNNFNNPIKLNSEWNSIGESQVVAYENNVYVVWGGNPDKKVAGNLFYTMSPDNGDSFSNAISLTGRDTLNVEVASDNDDVYIAWQGVLPDDNEEIFVKKSSDAGATFTASIENVSRNDGISECTSITISKDTRQVYLAWEDSPSGNHEILFSQAAITV